MTSRFSCFLNDISRVNYADMHMLPVLPPDEQTAGEETPTLAFITGYTEPHTVEDGSLFAVNTKKWHLCTAKSNPMLLDTGEDGWCLIFIPPCSPRVLIKNDNMAMPSTLSTAEQGEPVISSITKGALLLFAVANEIRTYGSVCLPEIPPSGSESSEHPVRRSPKAKAPDQPQSSPKPRKKP